MQTSATRPAVDVGPRSSRPGLALALGILSVPGSTIAFDLPGGGFWIGLPLGIAAIVLGVRARRDRNRSRMATVAIVLAVLSIGQMAVWTTVSAFSSSDSKAGASTPAVSQSATAAP